MRRRLQTPPSFFMSLTQFFISRAPRPLLKTLRLPLLGLLSVGMLAPIAHADTTPQALPFTQNWSDPSLILTDDDWSDVPGIIGYNGNSLTSSSATNPQTTLADGSATPVDVTANAANPAGTSPNGGGIYEFDNLPNPTVAFQGSGSADAPHLVFTLDTTGKSNIRVQYNLRDVDPTGDAVQQVALQFRVGTTGDYTDVPAGYVADASGDPDTASAVTAVDAILPAAANDQAVIQVRVISNDAPGSDQLIGVDDINITGATGTGPPTNTAPTVAPTIAPQNPGTDQTITVTPNGSDAENDALTYLYTFSVNGTEKQTGASPTFDLSVAGQGDAGDVVSVSVVANDGQLDSAPGTAQVTVAADAPPGNTPPTVAPKFDKTSYQTDDTITVNPNGADAENDPLTYTFVFSVNGAEKQNGASPTFDLSVAGNGDAGDTVAVTVTANDGTSDSTPVSISTVIAAAGTPPAIRFGVSLSPKGPLTNDSLVATPIVADGTGVNFAYEFFVNGKSVQSGAGQTLDLSQTGFGDVDDTVSVTVTASGSATGTASNSVTVFNSAPVARNITTGATSGQPVDIPLLASDVDGGPITFHRVGGPKDGVVTFGTDNSGNPVLTYTSRADFEGADTIDFVAIDDRGRSSAVQTLTVNVRFDPRTGPNVPPVAQNASGRAQAGQQVAIPITATDANGDPLTYRSVGGPKNGVGQFLIDTDNRLKFFYTSRARFSGTEVVRFVAIDDKGRSSNIATITIQVSYTPPIPANRPPVVTDVAANATPGQTVFIPVAGTDPDGDPLTYGRVGGPKNGTGEFTVVNGQSGLSYTSRANFTGTETVKYVAFDSKGRSSNVATISIKVQSAPAALSVGAANAGGSGGSS